MILSFPGHGGEIYVKLTWISIALPVLWLAAVTAFIVLSIIKRKRR